ncbi:serine acetyltransferase (plasmid) [Paracoccus yeei]|uniref:serine O-acetyltransferase n=2 Tax=Paracoccus yeei TaxID=147645 RepID=A0A386UTJ8_9RHOB|nr:serine O-acetyltransferase [Paracoccus yeei]AYF03987.1 serine acetyltransferase [Paracoccus yeei]QEU07162.1 serine acetyltransferase [Paracoccus yeei]
MDGLPPRDAPEDLDLGQVAEQLRLLRLVSQQRRYAGRPVPRLPVRAEITDLLAGLIAALYPRHYGPSGLPPDRTDGYVVALLPALRERLARQVELEFLLTVDAEPADCHDRARQTADRVMGALPRIRDLHDTDIAAAYAGDPSAKSLDEIVFCYPGVAAALRHRIAHELYGAGATMIARIMAEHSHSVTGIDIHPGARIGPACFIDHGTGVVIGETAVIGRNVRLYQQVTLGAKRFEEAGDGSLVKGQPRHPVIGDDVVIYAGATILGRITIGRGAVIGGGVWLTQSVAPGTVVTQARPKLDSLPAPD